MSLCAGDVAPYEVVFDVTSSVELGLDLATVTAAVLKVRRSPEEKTVDWPAVVTLQTSLSLRLTHVLEAGDLPKAGDYQIYAWMTVPGGFWRSKAKALPIGDPHKPSDDE